MKIRVSATIDKEKIKILKNLVKTGKYRNVSHVIETAVERLYISEEEDKK